MIEPTVYRALLLKVLVKINGKSLGWLENQPEPDLNLSLPHTALPA